MTPIDWSLAHEFLIAILREDIGPGDVTSRATVPDDAQAVARYTTKQPLVTAGVGAVAEIARLADPSLVFDIVARDGESVAAGSVLAELHGSARTILGIERATLNLLQRMCGIATLTHRFVDRIRGTRARIVDTRKTAPGMRVFDKYAVMCGGGMNHRVGLFDGILIKNNHLVFHTSVANAVRAARRHAGHLVKIEVEIHNLAVLEEAIAAGADLVLLDNFTLDDTREAFAIVAGRVPVESSGNMTLETVREYAEAGVNYISVGALTHSAAAADIHLRVAPAPDRV